MRFKIVIIIALLWSLSCTSKKADYEKSQDIFFAVKKSYEAHDYQAVLQYTNQLIAKDSTNGEFYYMRAVSKNRLLEIKGSIQDFKKASELNYRVLDSYYNISLNHQIEYNDSLAIVYLKKILQGDSMYFNARRDLLKLTGNE